MGKLDFIFILSFLLHLIFAIMLLAAPVAANTTPTNSLTMFYGGFLLSVFTFSINAVNRVISFTPPPVLLDFFSNWPATTAWALLITCLASVFSFIFYISKRFFASLIFILPQQFTLIITGLGAINAVYFSHYADLEIRPRAFIFTDQVSSILLAAIHIAAVMDQFGALLNIRLWTQRQWLLLLSLLPWVPQHLIRSHFEIK